jgi:hypothetical protein
MIHGIPTGVAGVGALSEDFVARRRDPESLLAQRRDDIVDYCATAEGLYTAVTRACMSIRPNGRVHNHQSRVPGAVRLLFAAALTEKVAGMGGRYVAGVQEAEAWSWNELWLACAACQQEIAGVGPVFAYDVAVRVGAYLGVKPDAVFCKAGTLSGTRALGRICGLSDGDVVPGEWVDVSWYARHGMKAVARYGGADGLEDALCTLREPLEYLAADVERRLGRV